MTTVAYSTPQALAKGPVAGIGGGAAKVSKYIEYTLPATFGTNATDYIDLFNIPKGAVVTGFTLTVADLDSGSATLTLSLGDSASSTRFLSASTIGQAGGSSSTNASPLYKYTTDDKIRLTATAAAATPTGGLLQLLFEYVIPDQMVTS
jgi:hypothetical protein